MRFILKAIGNVLSIIPGLEGVGNLLLRIGDKNGKNLKKSKKYFICQEFLPESRGPQNCYVCGKHIPTGTDKWGVVEDIGPGLGKKYWFCGIACKNQYENSMK
mgnify:CR=1 FL=1